MDGFLPSWTLSKHVATCRPPRDGPAQLESPGRHISCHRPTAPFQDLSSSLHHPTQPSLSRSRSLISTLHFSVPFPPYHHSLLRLDQSSMPPKHPARERAWGNRYDTLKLSSPPSSPTQRIDSSTTASSIPHSPNSHHESDTVAGNIPPPTKTSHDSSIFIGRHVHTFTSNVLSLTASFVACPPAWITMS